jgi:serine O-acetyltransferase
MMLVDDVTRLLEASPQTAAVLGLEPFEGFVQMAGALFASLCNNHAAGNVVAEIYANNLELVDLSCHDIAETARRNFEPGGAAAAFLFSRGVQAIMGHRVAHHLWVEGNTDLALAMKAMFGRTFSTDIHPAAQIGAGIWLDHGLGFVVGETAVIGEDVSIWHNVTLGSTLNDSGAYRHPRIGRGVVIGAGATLLGGITVGANANIAAGAIVVQDVPQGALAVGIKATVRGQATVRFGVDKGTT